ncbi:hypothetical protein ACSS6W_001935 [Trichoderma asperelloides]
MPPIIFSNASLASLACRTYKQVLMSRMSHHDMCSASHRLLAVFPLLVAYETHGSQFRQQPFVVSSSSSSPCIADTRFQDE